MKKNGLFLAILVVIAGVFLAACGSSEADKKGNYLNVFMGAQPNTLDPSKGSDLYGNTVLLNTIEPLVRFDSSLGKIIPSGAESWTISDDGLVYTFKIRSMKWNDGTPVRAQDYAFGIRRSADPATGCLYANLLYPLKNGMEVFAGDVPMDKLGVATPDDNTLVLTLKNPMPYFLDTAMQRTYFPQREDWVEKYGDTYATSPDTAPQCGPFVLTDWTINSVMNFKKNADFWNVANVPLDTIKCSIINDTVAINNALLAGEIDLASVADPKWQSKFSDESVYRHVVSAQADVVYMLINCDNEYLSNAKIRRSLSIALDRTDYIEATRHGVGLPAYWFSPPAVTCQGEAFNEVGKGPLKDYMDKNVDPRELFIEGLKELGIDKDPSDITLPYLSSGVDQDARTEVEYIQQTMKEKIGVNIDPSMNEWNEFINKIDSQSYGIAILAWGADFNDPCNFLETAWPLSGTYKTGWDNEEFNKCITDAQVESDPAKRFELLKRAETILIVDEAALIPVVTRERHSFQRLFVKNVSSNYFDWMGWQKIDTSERGK